MSNPFDEISAKLDMVLSRIDAIESKSNHKPKRIGLSEFCRVQGISRPTCYSWAAKGLIELEKIGGRRFVAEDSIGIVKKFQRKEQA